ncbi:RNA-directed DNA polymerase [Zavarzinia sp. CC-PAN008]|uniref:RNA-directed DNA polymerase n=1 Tax=Zavarzinia sp. CC-PAN008 TaxID=3243332 RepID=UPI003F74918C
MSLGPIEFDEKVVKKQLARDLVDDWFPDPLNFTDLLESDHIERILRNNFVENHGEFAPHSRTLLNIPKPNYTLRYGLETSFCERALYHALVSRLVPTYDTLIPWNVFSHRAAQGDRERYLFRRPIPAWRDFTGIVRNTIGASDYLLSTDLTNYFENISLSELKRTIVSFLPEVQVDANEKAAIRANVELLFSCLKSWAYSETGGLPQNRDASSFLANIYMLPIDRALLQQGYKYFRYMDDIKIVCSDKAAARRALKALTIELRKRGLAVNAGKTQIAAASETQTIGDCLDSGEPELQRIDSIWQTRQLRPISRSFPLLRAYTLRKLREGDVASRGFRYCIRRLEALAVCAEFEVPEAYFTDITRLVLEALPEHPASSDELARYLRAVPTKREDLDLVGSLLTDAGRNFYTWQCYRLWLLLVQKKHRDEALVAYAMQVVRSGGDNAARCGATLYAGAFGTSVDRIGIAERFSDLRSFLGQRAALLAIQELHFKPHVAAYVMPNLRADLLGVYRGLGRRGIYMAPPKPISITRILDTERDYD